jgi:phosphoglycerate dehydrogenase-like enzyme
MTEEELLVTLQGVDASLASSEPYTRRVLDTHPTLRVIARAGVGYDAVDVEAASEHGIPVTTTPGANHEAVAEHTYALMLALVKDLIRQTGAIRTGQWHRKTNLPLRGRTLGIIGLGRIGKAVACRAGVFHLRVLANDILPDEAFAAAHGVTLVSFEQVLAEADFLSLHVPLTPLTKHFINRQSLALMKPTAFLINTSRGRVVCEADLFEALKDKKLAGAGLDVYEHEPPRESPLLELDNVVLTPHTAGIDAQSMIDMAMGAAEAIAALSRGEWPADKVLNPKVREKFHW